MLAALPIVHSAKDAPKPAVKPVYHAVGAPAKPQVKVHWNTYHDYAESTEILQALTKAYPNQAKLQSLGKSIDGREMWVLTITDFLKGAADKKTGMWIDGAIHANEVQATEVVLYTAWWVLESRAQNPAIAKLLEDRTFYLMPMMSPDSRDAHFYKANTTHSPRTGQRPVDDDRDGLVDEDPADDLDGDGHITQMRVKDRNGEWKPHPDYPELMVRVKDGEKGEYRLLGSEGIDNDGDDLVNEDGDGFYDPNRDWGHNWQPTYVQNGAYRYPFSILENRMVADFIAGRPNIAGAQSYHNAGGMILRGPGDKMDKYDAADNKALETIAKRGEEMLPGYKSMNIAAELYEVYGGEVDWLYTHRGIAPLTNELFTGFNFFRKSSDGGFFGSPEDQQKFNKLLLLGEGFVAWHAVEHPQFGKIEVGGQKKNWIRQPPSFLLEEECHRNMAFTLYHAFELPQIEIQSASAKSLGGNLTEITVVVENPKILPTRLAFDAARNITPPDVATIRGEKLGKVVAAMTSDEPFFRHPEVQRRDPGQIKLKTVPGRGVVYFRWLVEGSGPFTVEVVSVKGGTVKQEVPKEAPKDR